MLQKVLTVARTIFHLTDHADKVGVQAVDTQVDSCALTSFHNLLLNLFAHLVDNLLDSGGVNAAVGHKLVKGQAGDFAAHRVEARQHDCLGGVVDYDFNPGSGFEGTDVTAFAPDYAPLDFIGIDMEHGYGVFNGGLGGDTLYRLDYDTLCLLVGCHLGLVHNFVDILGGSRLGLILERFYKFFPGFLRRKTGDMFQCILRHTFQLVQFLLAGLDYRFLGVEALAHRVEFVALALVLALLLVELHFTLLHLCFRRLHAAKALVGLLFSLIFYLDALFTAFEKLLLTYHFRFTGGFVENRFCTAACH